MFFLQKRQFPRFFIKSSRNSQWKDTGLNKNVIFRSFFFLGSDSVATLLKGLKSIPHRIRLQNILKHYDCHSNSRPPYWKQKKLTNWKWTWRVRNLSKNTKTQTQVVSTSGKRKCGSQNDTKTAWAFLSVSVLKRAMLLPEHHENF